MKVGLVGYGKMGRGIFSLLSDAPLEAAVLVRDQAKADQAELVERFGGRDKAIKTGAKGATPVPGRNSE